MAEAYQSILQNKRMQQGMIGVINYIHLEEKQILEMHTPWRRINILVWGEELCQISVLFKLLMVHQKRRITTRNGFVGVKFAKESFCDMFSRNVYCGTISCSFLLVLQVNEPMHA